MYSNEVFYEEKTANEIAVTFNAPEYFSANGYSALANSVQFGFVPCSQTMFDGKIKLIYNVAAFTSLYEMLPYMTPDMFERVSANLINKLQILRNNRYLRCENVYLSTDKIFVNTNTMDVYLVYLPLETNDTTDYMPMFEKKLREKLDSFVSKYPNLKRVEVPAAPPVAPVAPPPVAPVVAPHAAPVTPAVPPVHNIEPVVSVPTSRLSGVSYVFRSNCSSPDIRITSDEFVIGKSQSRVDGVVSGSNLVSRVHCKAILKDGACYIMDLNSLNGTCLNGRRINPGEMYKLVEGVRISIADMDFIFAVE